MRTPLVIGNWKMNGILREASSLARGIAQEIRKKPFRASIVLAPPATALTLVQREIRSSAISLAGQNCHWQESGAFTGETSPVMLRDVGCQYVITGHSERRHIFHEDDDIVAKKVAAALRNDLRAILCVGETLTERTEGSTMKIITRQLRSALKGLSKNVIRRVEVAYEPVWAIGTGRNADPAQIAEVHGRIRRFLAKTFGQTEANQVRILYGGSVNPENATQLAETSDVDGLLVGGASLNGRSFIAVLRCFDSKKVSKPWLLR